MTAAMAARPPAWTRCWSRSPSASAARPRSRAAACGSPAPGPDRGGLPARPRGRLEYLKTITAGEVSDARLRAYVETGPRDARLRRRAHRCRAGLEAGLPGLLPRGARRLRAGQRDQPRADRPARSSATTRRSCCGRRRSARAGMWMRPLELKPFFTIRQSWRGKSILLRFLWRSVRARFTGERIATMGQALAAELWLGMRRARGRGLARLAAAYAAHRRRRGGRGCGGPHEGREVRVAARGGVVLATGGFEHNPEMRARVPALRAARTSASATPAHRRRDPRRPRGRGEGRSDGRGLVVPDPGLAERAQAHDAERADDARPVHRQRRRPALHQRGDAVLGVRPRDDRGRGGRHHLHADLADHRRPRWKRYVVAGHLPLPRIPFAPVPTGGKMVEDWLEAGVVRQGDSWAELAAEIGVPAAALERTARRYNEVAASGHDDDFGRGESAYDRYYGDARCPTRTWRRCGAALLRVPDRARRPRHQRRPEDRRGRPRARRDGSPIAGLYATGNTPPR